MSQDIHGAFDSAWWNELLQHLWSLGMMGKILLCSYLCDRTLLVAHVCWASLNTLVQLISFPLQSSCMFTFNL